MGVIQTKDGLFRVFNNWLDCPLRGNCEGQEEREARQIMHHCSRNPSIYGCKFYTSFNPKKEASKTPKVYNLNCL